MNNFEKVSKKNKQAIVSSGKRLLKGIGDNKKSVRRVCVEDYLPITPWTLASKVSFRVSQNRISVSRAPHFFHRLLVSFPFLFCSFTLIFVFSESLIQINLILQIWSQSLLLETLP